MFEYHSHLPRQNRLPHPSFPPSYQRETTSREAYLPRTTPQMMAADSTLLLLLSWSTFLGIISLVLLKFFSKLERGRISGFTSHLVPPVPCRNCCFFAQNQYLHCAVHPSTVLTAQAANCSDYCCSDDSDLR